MTDAQRKSRERNSFWLTWNGSVAVVIRGTNFKWTLAQLVGNS
jgi:hypothetical protein